MSLIPLKSSPKDFPFSQEKCKILNSDLKWQTRLSSPSLHKCISLYLNSSSTPISSLIESLCKLVPPTQNLWHIPARIISTQLSSPSLNIIYSDKAFLSLKTKENPITLSDSTLFFFIAGSTVTNYTFISVLICWMSVSTLEAHLFKGKDSTSLFLLRLRQYPAHDKHSRNICRVDD